MSLEPIAVSGGAAPVVPAQAIAVNGGSAPAAPSSAIVVNGEVAPTAPSGAIVVGGGVAPTVPSGAIVVGGETAPTVPAGAIPVSGHSPAGVDGVIDADGGIDPEIPEAIVVDGETDPALVYVQPDAPVAVDHTVPLANDQNYRVMVGSRAAPITVALPDPGGIGQDIEIIDASMQANIHAITIAGGSRQIEGQSALVLNYPGAAVRITYTQAGTWKITS